MQEEHVLIISYYFPPFKRVGGRRWAKHAKYMNRFGVSTYVLAADFPDSVSAWDQDVLEYRNKITRIAVNQEPPFFKKKLPSNSVEKIHWKLSLYKHNVRRLLKKGNYNDQSWRVRTVFFKEAKRIIDEKDIKILILSVGPFGYSTLIPELRKAYPDLKIVIDYRDKREDSFSGLSPQRINFETREQKKVLAVCDLILTVNNNISAHLRHIAPRKDVFTLPHCVDEDFYRISELKSGIPANEAEDYFVYGGELYNGMNHELETFAQFLQLYKEKSRLPVKTAFYLTYPAYEPILDKAGIERLGFLPKDDFIAELLKSRYILLFRPPWSSEAFSSKFFEILCLRKPVLYFGNKGLVSEFLEEHRLGYHIVPENLEQTIKELLENKITMSVPDQSFDLKKYTFESYTLSLLEKLNLAISKNKA